MLRGKPPGAAMDLAQRYPVVTITGPRQSGKTTLCRKAFPTLKYANLEAPDVRSFATEDPRGFLAAHSGGAILDEIQRAPYLLSYIQDNIDAENEPGRFILTGSQQFEVMNTICQGGGIQTADYRRGYLRWQRDPDRMTLASTIFPGRFMGNQRGGFFNSLLGRDFFPGSIGFETTSQLIR
jgi:hypothetical protein